jgi:hypothetical protein
MDVVIDNRFSGMYGLKLTRFMASWIAVVITRKFFSDDYVHRVVVNGKPPRPLTSMVALFFGVQACFEIILATILALLANVMTDKAKCRSIFPVFTDREFVGSFIVDVIGTNLIAFAVCWSIASVIGDRTRFDYLTQGTRAARAMEELMVNVLAVTYLVPFFLLV